MPYRESRPDRDPRPRERRRLIGESGATVALLSLVALVALLAVGCATGCASFYTQSDFDPGADFSALRTYEWVPRVLTNAPRDPRIDNDLLDGRVRRAVDAALAEKGFLPAPAGEKPDFRVNYHISLEQKFDVQAIPSTYGYGLGWYGGPGYADVYVDEYELGTLFLDVIDAKSNALVWRGYTSGRVLPDLTPEEREARTSAAVRAILERFPPPGR